MDVSRILPNLMVGSYPRGPRDIDSLNRDYGVSAVLNVQADDGMAYWGLGRPFLETHYRKLGIQFRRIPVRDFDPDDLRKKLPQPFTK